MTLLLAEDSENTLTAGSHSAGIQAPAGTTLTIGGTGILKATGGYFGAGIGGGEGVSGGNITISGGMVTAVGNTTLFGSGIGGGRNGNGGDITISGGMVIATGGASATGIGGFGPSGTPGTLDMTGNAIVFANSVSATVTSDDEAGGILVRGGVMNWYGGDTIEINYDATIPDDRSIIIPQWKALSIYDDITFTNEGYIFGVVEGVVEENPAVAPTATIDLSESDPPPYGIEWAWDGDTEVYTVFNDADIEVVGDNQLPDPTQRRIEVAEDAVAKITLNGVSITELDAGQSPLLLNDGAEAEIVLADGSENTLTGGFGASGVQVPSGAKLKIGGTGSLTATGGDGGAGIGGGNGDDSGTVNISNITALTAIGGAGALA
ncbi:MAG: carbohydrate-binding domain-containing protein [Clostridiales bacterium]|nr:carbohydrate-binding domain-containing protein [Clostridiales bacterium]